MRKVLAYLDYNRSYNHPAVIIQATYGQFL